MPGLVGTLLVFLIAAEQPVTVLSLPSLSIDRDWMDRATLGFSAVLTIVGIIGVVAAIWTLNAVKKQADEMVKQAEQMREQTAVAKQAADAALLNAQAVINAERPWMMIEPDFKVVIVGENQLALVSFKATNVGRSPAEIIYSATEWKAELVGQQLNEHEQFFSEHIPITSQWTHAEWKAPGEYFQPNGVEISSAQQNEMWNLLAKGTMALIVMGFVRYRDPLSGGVHESRYCYSASVQLRSIVMTGPAGYNRLT